MAELLTFYSHRQGANPWKTVIVLEELGLRYKTIFLDFGDGANGVEGTDFLKKNPAGRVPLIWDPKTGISLTESNAIAHYLVDHYDPNKTITLETKPDRYLVEQWLYYQAATQGPIFQQTFLFKHNNLSADGLSHLRGIVKRTMGTINAALEGKMYLVGEKCTIADLSYVSWDLILDQILEGDEDVGTREQREEKYPFWAAWHKRLLDRPAVKKMIQLQEEANA